MDLKLPRVGGEDVLHEIKHHPELENVPIVVLTGLDEGFIESVNLDHDADEDAIFKKPIGPSEFIDVIFGFESFRFRLSVSLTTEAG